MVEKREIKINFDSYNSLEELEPNYKKLMQEAQIALESSYSPYSEFKVGAALLMQNGQIIHGSNQENASYPLGFCAERTALSAAVAIAPKEKIDAIAITCKSKNKIVKEPLSPCGNCRQTILEAELKHQQNIVVILKGESDKVYIFKSIKDLLPLYFDSEYL